MEATLTERLDAACRNLETYDTDTLRHAYPMAEAEREWAVRSGDVFPVVWLRALTAIERILADRYGETDPTARYLVTELRRREDEALDQLPAVIERYGEASPEAEALFVVAARYGMELDSLRRRHFEAMLRGGA